MFRRKKETSDIEVRQFEDGHYEICRGNEVLDNFREPRFVPRDESRYLYGYKIYRKAFVSVMWNSYLDRIGESDKAKERKRLATSIVDVKPIEDFLAKA